MNRSYFNVFSEEKDLDGESYKKDENVLKMIHRRTGKNTVSSSKPCTSSLPRSPGFSLLHSCLSVNVIVHGLDARFTQDPANKLGVLKVQIRIATISSQTTFQLSLLQISIELRHGHRYGYKQVAAGGYGSPDCSLKEKWRQLKNDGLSFIS